jgi:cell wall-associated NlpC family hydrolase
VARSSISGLGVALATAGGLLLYTGIRNVSIVDGLRDVIGGKPPGTTPGAPVGPALASLVTNVDKAIAANTARQGLDVATGTGTQPGGPLGRAIADAARAYLGKPYVWAGTFANGGGGDCSGLVYRALNDIGIHVPRLITTGFLVWTGATSIPRDQCAEGDLVCWTGHIGIAVSNTQMINAPHTGAVVRVDNIWTQPPPVIRRVKTVVAQGLSAK